jgi:hypothetical protein
MTVRLRVDCADHTEAEAPGNVTIPLELPVEVSLDLKACTPAELERLGEWLENDLELAAGPARARVRRAAQAAGS